MADREGIPEQVDALYVRSDAILHAIFLRMIVESQPEPEEPPVASSEAA